jgi:hypothetical protein
MSSTSTHITPLEQVESNPNFLLKDAHLNKIGNDVLTFANQKTGQTKVFTNVSHDESINPTEQQPPKGSLESVQQDSNMKLVEVHSNKIGNDVLTFENKFTHDTKVFPNVHHSEENKHGGEGHYVLSDVENDSQWTLISRHKNQLGNYTCVYESKEGHKATFPNVKLE